MRRVAFFAFALILTCLVGFSLQAGMAADGSDSANSGSAASEAAAASQPAAAKKDDAKKDDAKSEPEQDKESGEQKAKAAANAQDDEDDEEEETMSSSDSSAKEDAKNGEESKTEDEPKAKETTDSKSEKVSEEAKKADKQEDEEADESDKDKKNDDKAAAKTAEKKPFAILKRKSADKKPAAKSADGKSEEKKSDEKSVADKSKSDKADGKKSEEAAPKKATVVCFTIKGDYPEGPTAPGVFGDIQPSLGVILQRMDAAAADKNVAAVWLKIESLQLGRGKIHELRAAIARLRKAGKPVYGELTSATNQEYLVAVACDQVTMAPSGSLLVPGVRAEMMFYKGLLDKVGLEFDALQMGKYKGAVEPYTRDKMSEPLRESMEAIVDDLYADMVSTIASDRHQLDFQVKSLLDHGLFTAETAKKAGLIDRVAYSDELQEELKKKLNVESLEVVTNYKRKHLDTDFSGISGMMKFMELMMGGKQAADNSKKPKIAVVYAVGAIMEGRSTSDMFGNTSLGSTTLISSLRKAAENPKVAAVVLRIDSPGGSATASDLIWRETVRMKKPIIASMSDVAGSGGYYIAMGAKKIFAAPGTLTGSIGVIGGKMVTRGLFDKVGVTTEVISRGANSGSLSSLQPFSEAERKVWTSLLEDTYKQFVGKAAEGRKMPFEKLDELAQGRVYTGRMAKRLGLVDEVGTLDDAIAAAKVAAGLQADAEVDLLMLPEPRSMFEQLFGDPGAGADLDSILPAPLNVLAQVKMLRRLFSEPTLVWMPFTIQIR